MSEDVRNRAEDRLSRAVAEGGFADPRPPLRERLRALRETDGGGFDEARRHYENEVLPELATGADPLGAWIDYGAWLAALAAPGRVLAVDVQGTAQAYRAPPGPGQLILHVPDDTAAGVLVLAAPAAPSAAQRATLDLLVNRKLSL